MQTLGRIINNHLRIGNGGTGLIQNGSGNAGQACAVLRAEANGKHQTARGSKQGSPALE